MVRPALSRRSTALCLVVCTLAAVGCSTGSGPRSGPEPSFLVGYGQAAGTLDLLDGLDPAESVEQVRDYALLGLAASLGLNRDQVVAAMYDTAPVRAPAFADLVRQPSGPGRNLFDGTTLHVLVPVADPHRARTVGQAVDDHRTNSGSDPARVQIHTYRILPQTRQIELVAEDPAPTSVVRTRNGWHETQIDSAQGLADFLATTNHLSRVEERGSQVWAAGWNWPDVPGGRVTADDVAVLQRGYRSRSLPGFSLDPATASTPADVRAVLPWLSPAVAQALTSGKWSGTGYSSPDELRAGIQRVLYQGEHVDGLPDDRTQLWALLNVLDRRPSFNQERFDGGIAGTEVGMTTAYTDLVAKDWVTGVGTGIPADAVPGFVPDPKAPTPEGLCAGQPDNESGRLWFGQADNAFTYTPTSMDVGPVATRLYNRSNGGDGTEVAPSYSFDRGTRWWDQHFQQVADYEPQFTRLDQLMRWSGALEWLARNEKTLPATATDNRLTFSSWYASHNELRERAPLTVVQPPAAEHEALLTKPSATFPNCGLLEIRGGVALGDGLARGTDQGTGNANLPPDMRRAGPADPTTRVSDGSGTIERTTKADNNQISGHRTIGVRRGPDVTTIVTTASAPPLPWGGHPSHDRTNEVRTTVQAGDHSVTVDVQVGGMPVARASATEIPNSGARRQADVTVRPGMKPLLAEAARLVAKDAGHGMDVPWVHYHFQDAAGNLLYRTAAGWIEVSKGDTSSTVFDTIDVRTSDGQVLHVRAVAPARLTADLGNMQVVRQQVVGVQDVGRNIADADQVYVSGSSAAGLEPAKVLAQAINGRQRVKIITAQTTAATNGPGELTELANGGWTRVDHSLLNGGNGSRSGTGGGSGGGLSIGDLIGLGGGIVLVIGCPDQDDHPRDDRRREVECA